MARFLGVLVIIVAVVVGLGLYLGWFQFGSDTTEGKTHVTFTVDQEKIKADEKRALEKIRGTVNPKSQTAPAPESQK
jgi:hypothetical protein